MGINCRLYSAMAYTANIIVVKILSIPRMAEIRML